MPGRITSIRHLFHFKRRQYIPLPYWLLSIGCSEIRKSKK